MSAGLILPSMWLKGDIHVETQLEAQMCINMIASREALFANCGKNFPPAAWQLRENLLEPLLLEPWYPGLTRLSLIQETKVGQSLGPIQTETGHHVILLEKRTGGGDKY